MKYRISPLVERLRGLRKNPVLHRLALYGVSSGVSQVIMMVYGIAVARYLGLERYGLFASNYALAGITIFFVNWGMDTWMLREGGAQPDSQKLSGVVLRAKLLTGLPWLLALLGLAPLIRPDLFPRAILLVVALDLLCDSITGTLVSGLNIARRTREASWVLLLARSGRLAGALVLIFSASAGGPFAFALLRLAATLLGGGLAYRFLRPDWGDSGVTQTRQTLRASLPYSLPELLALVYAQVDVTLIGLLATLRQVGEYSPAVSLINALTIVPVSIFSIVVPVLTEAFLHNRHSFPRLARQMSLVYLMVGISLAAGTALVLAPLFALLLGEQYRASGQLVLLMSSIPLWKSLSFIGATYLVVIGQQVKRIRIQLFSAVLNIGLNLLVIPRFGTTGAGMVYIASEFVLAVGYLSLAWGEYRRQARPGADRAREPDLDHQR